jgi:hypothetical protein
LVSREGAKKIKPQKWPKPVIIKTAQKPRYLLLRAFAPSRLRVTPKSAIPGAGRTVERTPAPFPPAREAA